MKSNAHILLIVGSVLLGFGLMMAIATAPENVYRHNVHITPDASELCMSCHEDAHSGMVLQMDVYTIELTHFGESDSKSGPVNNVVQQCQTCHFFQMDRTVKNAASEELQVTKQRVALVRDQLSDLYQAYPIWNIQADRVQKSDIQVTAEQVETLLLFVEAEETWSFHRPQYTETLLQEAETLINNLTVATQ